MRAPEGGWPGGSVPGPGQAVAEDAAGPDPGGALPPLRLLPDRHPAQQGLRDRGDDKHRGVPSG